MLNWRGMYLQPLLVALIAQLSQGKTFIRAITRAFAVSPSTVSMWRRYRESWTGRWKGIRISNCSFGPRGALPMPHKMTSTCIYLTKFWDSNSMKLIRMLDWHLPERPHSEHILEMPQFVCVCLSVTTTCKLVLFLGCFLFQNSGKKKDVHTFPPSDPNTLLWMRHSGGAGLPVQAEWAAGTVSCYHKWQGREQKARMEKNQSLGIRREQMSVTTTCKLVLFWGVVFVFASPVHSLSLSFAWKQLKLIHKGFCIDWYPWNLNDFMLHCDDQVFL